LRAICPESRIEYGDFDDVKELCKRSSHKESLGSDKVLENHIEKLKFKDIESSFKQGDYSIL